MSQAVSAKFFPNRFELGTYQDLNCPYCNSQVDFYVGTDGVIQLIYEFCTHVHIWSHGREIVFLKRDKDGALNTEGVEIRKYNGIKFIKDNGQGDFIHGFVQERERCYG